MNENNYDDLNEVFEELNEREYPEDDLTAWEEEQVFRDQQYHNLENEDYEPSEDSDDEIDIGWNDYFETEY